VCDFDKKQEMRMDRTLTGMSLVTAAALAIGYGVGSAQGQQKPAVDPKVLGTVDGGEECPGHVLRMRRVTFAPGSSIPMHAHKDHPEVSLIIEGTLTNTVNGQQPVQLAAEHLFSTGRKSSISPPMIATSRSWCSVWI
jgi:hypothetical protein